MKLLENNHPILLRRLRDLRRPRFLENRDLYDIGSLVVVMYASPKKQNRERIKRILSNAPCIRLCRSVYAFTHFHPRFDRERQVVDTQTFVSQVKEVYGDVKVIPRTIIVNKESIDRLREETEKRIERDVSKILRHCKRVFQNAHRGDDIRPLKRSLSRIKKRYRRTKKVARFYEKWLKIDLSKHLMRSYLTLRKTDSALKQEEVKRILNLA